MGKWVKVGKMGHTGKVESHLQEWETLENGSHLEKWVTLENIVNTWKNGSHLKKCVTLGSLDHTLKKWVTL